MKKTSIVFLFLLIGLSLVNAQVCPIHSISFVTQQQVDSFPILYPGCTTIDGDLIISETFIHSITGLSSLIAIEGGVYINNNDQLTNLQGLNNITFIGGNLSIGYNDNLENLFGLESLSVLQGDFTIYNSEKITNLAGLSNLTQIGGIIDIDSNPDLHNLSGLDGLTSLKKDIYIQFNPALTDLTGLNNISEIQGGLNIYSNRIQSLHGLENVVYVAGKTDIAGNDSLKNLSGLNGLLFFGGDVTISNNKDLESLSGLGNLKQVFGACTISYNQRLVEIGDLPNLRNILYSLYIFNNYSLENLNGLDSLNSLGGNLWVNGNSSIQDLAALNNLDSITGYLAITYNIKINKLTGLENIKYIGNGLLIYNNDSLTNINDLANVQTLNGNLRIYNNPLLSTCDITPVCNQLSMRPPEASEIHDNGLGCATPLQVEIACGGLPIIVTVRLDGNVNCQNDSTDLLAGGIMVSLVGSEQMALRATPDNGIVGFGYLNNGAFSLSLPQFPTQNWQACHDTLSFLPDTIPEDTIRANFFLQPLTQCPQLTVDLNLPPFFRGCLVTTPMQVVTNNIGTINAEDVITSVVMPDGLELVSSDPQLASQLGDTLFFNIGELSPFQTGTVNMVVKTSCSAVQLGQALCVEAFATLTNPCPVTTPPASEIRLFSECLSDTTVRFTIKNVGNAATQNTHDYVIIEDEVILRSENFSLNALDTILVDLPGTGATYRMEATQYDDGSLTATALENCGGFTPGFITAYWLNEGLRDYDYDCREIRNAYDPNQKTAVSTGVGPEHLLAANKSITYTIDFQNTGTDTAFRVQLRDVLPPQLNPFAFRPGFSSHPYTWQIVGGDTLEVLFQPIMLPDSNVNEAASHGWFSFDIEQKPDLPDGTTIENTAAIVFDYNPPIITNTVLHTIGKLTVSVDEPPTTDQNWQVLSNPARYSAIFRSKTITSGTKHFELTDALGRVVRTEHFEGQEFEFQRGHLSGGLYYFHIIPAQGQGCAGKIMLTD